MCIPLLKLEDWDIADHEKFPHLATNKYVTKIYYEEAGFTSLEPMKWVKGIEQAGLLHMLCVSHFHRSIINNFFFCQFLTLVHDGCLWLGETIPITHMLIHRITKLPYTGANVAKKFGGKIKEKELTDKMKTEYGLVRKSHGYSIHSIVDPMVWFATQILVGKVIRKCCVDEVSVLVISLAT